MAVTVTLADQLVEGFRRYPISSHGKLRFQYGKIVQGAAAGDIGSTLIICNLPPGRKRILPYLSRYKLTALGAARTMAVGHRAYFASTDSAAVAEAENAAAFMTGVDVSGATEANWPVTPGLKYDMFSRAEIEIFATISGGTIPAAAVAEFFMAYLYE